MNKQITILLLVALTLFGVQGFSQDKKQKKKRKKSKQTEMELTTTTDKISYGLGMNIGQNLKSQGFDTLNYEAFLMAIKTAYEGGEFKMDPNAANQMINSYFEEKKVQMLAANKKAGEDFLAENGKKEGIKTLPSGLQYEVLVEGNGPKPTANDRVTTHYHGTLIDGTVFDSSVERGQPATFPVNGVIKGWTEALQLMPVGSKWRLFIPSDLAYGDRGAGAQIQPNSTLIFEVELLSIN